MDPLLLTIIVLAIIVGISFALGRGLLAENRPTFSLCEPIQQELLALLAPLNSACRGDAIVWPAGNLAEIVAATTGEKPSESWQQKLEAIGIHLVLIHTATGKPIAAVRMIECPESESDEDDEDPEIAAFPAIQVSNDPLVKKVLEPLGAQLLEITWAEEYDEVALHRAIRPLFKAAKLALRKSA